MFLSLIYSCDITRPFRPDAPTNEYPQFFLGYYAMFYAGAQLSSKKLRKMVLATFVGLALFESVIGILQTLGVQIQPMLFAKTSNEFVYVLTQNTNIYGALCILFAGAIAGSFVFTTNRVHKIILGILFVPCIYCSYYTMSRLSWLGVMVMMCFLLVSILIMKARNKGDARYKGYLKSLGILFAILVVTAVSCYFLNVSESMARFQQTTEEISSAEGGNVSEIGSGRGVIWGFCFEALPRHWVTGVGLDNLYQCYIENHKWIQGMYYSNQAHNEYLQVLTTQGVFAFINYMAMLVLSGVFAVRRVLFNDDDEDRKITWIYLGMFAGFVVAMFFLFRTFTVEPYFCAVIGLMNPRVHKFIDKAGKKAK